MRVEISISDPWELASAVPGKLTGTIEGWAGDSVNVLFDRPISLSGETLIGVRATPRHAGASIHSAPGPLAVNLALVGSLQDLALASEQSGAPDRACRSAPNGIGTLVLLPQDSI